MRNDEIYENKHDKKEYVQTYDKIMIHWIADSTETMDKTSASMNNNFRNDAIMPTARRIKNIQPAIYIYTHTNYTALEGTVVTVNHTVASYLNRWGINLISGLPRRAQVL